MPDFLSFLKEDKPQQAGQKATANDFLSGLRNQGYFDLGGDLYTTKSNADFAHNTVMIVYRASTYISDFVTMIPWEIKSKKSGEVTATHKDPDGHPLSVAITQQYVKSKQPFFALWSKALSLAGENYIEPIKEQNILTGRIGTRYVALDWLQPALVDPYTMYGILQGFYYSAHGRSEFFQPHELVYDHLYNAVDENRGWSPVLAAMNEVNLDRDSKRAFKSWFRNGMLPPVIFSPAKEDGMLGTGIDDALDKLRDQLKEKHRGAGNAYRSLVLNYPVDVTTVNQPDINRNVDILQYWKHEIANAFGLPPVVLGDTSATPFKDAPEILAAAYSGAVRSQLVRMEASVNIELMPFFDDSGEFILEFDKEKYEKLGDDLQKNQDLQNQAYETGAITMQTYRQRIGATEDDDNELWKQLPDMVKVPGILAPVPLSELDNLWKEFLPSAQQQADLIQAIADDFDLEDSSPSIPSEVPLLEAEIEPEAKDALPTPLPGAKSAWISLDLAGNETVKQLQQQAQEMFPDMEVADPGSFHLTLLYMPDMEKGRLLNSVIEDIVPRPIELKAQNIDLLGQDNAIVVKVELTNELKRLQEDMVSQAKNQNVSISEFHEPGKFIPHFTLGYMGKDYNKDNQLLPQSVKADAIAANDITVSVEDGDEYEQVDRIEKVSSKKAIMELSQWGRFQKKSVAGKHLTERTFDFSQIRPSVETYIKAQMELGIEWKTILSQATAMHRMKAIATTKANYMQTVAAMISDARAGRIAKTRARENFRNLNKNTISRVYTDGLEDAGVFEETISDETKEAIRKFKLEPTPFVKDLMNRIYSEEGISDAEAAGKPLAWWNGSISAVYSAGLIAGNENGMYEFAGKSGRKDPGKDCKRLMVLPDRHRLSTWDAKGLNMAEGAFVGQKTACGGHKCEHFIRRTTGRAQGRF